MGAAPESVAGVGGMDVGVTTGVSVGDTAVAVGGTAVAAGSIFPQPTSSRKNIIAAIVM
jgi:hypothetical protein